MNIESTKISYTNDTKSTPKTSKQENDSPSKFSNELKDLESSQKNTEKTEEVTANETDKTIKTEQQGIPEEVTQKNEGLNQAIDGLSKIVEEFNQSEDKNNSTIKKNNTLADNQNMINNDYSIQDNKDLLAQMSPNMNFSGDGQPFSSFMNNNNEKETVKLNATSAELAEEAAILSTMAENIAIANKNKIQNLSSTNTNNEISVNFNNIIMNSADVEVFINIVQNGGLDIKDITSEATTKSIQVSKTLAEMLLKCKENNQPLRIDFDNDISIIIRISREGKISADFLPSSQIAEAYLKENLPILKQRFDESGIKYEELNQRERKEQHRENNRKKGRNDE